MDYTGEICVASWQIMSCGKLHLNLQCFKCHIRASPKSMVNFYLPQQLRRSECFEYFW